MKTSDTQVALIGSLFEAWRVFPAIAKTKQGQAGNRTFKYAPFDDVLDAVRPALIANGLMLTQGTDGHSLTTRLDHISGEWRETSMPMNAEHANMQSYGIEMTYRRRYAAQAILGIITEEDIDAKEKNRKTGLDHTEPRNTNGTLQGLGGMSGRDVVGQSFDALQPEIQDQFRRAAGQVEAAMPDVRKAIQTMEVAMDNWPDEDRNELKKALWFLLDSKTRTAISKEQKK